MRNASKTYDNKGVRESARRRVQLCLGQITAGSVARNRCDDATHPWSPAPDLPNVRDSRSGGRAMKPYRGKAERKRWKRRRQQAAGLLR